MTARQNIRPPGYGVRSTATNEDKKPRTRLPRAVVQKFVKIDHPLPVDPGMVEAP